MDVLGNVDHLLIEHHVRLGEVLGANEFAIKNNKAQKLFYATEDCKPICRQCCGSERSFHLKIFDSNYQHEVIHCYRPLKCGCSWSPCSLQKIEVSSPPGSLVGTVEQKISACSAKFHVKDSNGNTVLIIKRPFFCCRRKPDFIVMSNDGKIECGKVSKKWSDLPKEFYTNNFGHCGISFPVNLDVKIKAVLLGACFLIRVMYFEDYFYPVPVLVSVATK